MLSMPMTKACQVMAGIAAIAHQNERSIRKPMNQYRHELTRQINQGLMPSSLGRVQLFRTIQGAKHWQRPGPRGERKLHLDRQHDPFVSPYPDGMAVRGAAGVVMPPFAIHPFAFVLWIRVVHRTDHGLMRGNQVHYETCQYFGQWLHGPHPAA